MAHGDRPIAIDFGAASLKALQIAAADDGDSIIAAAALDTPENLRDDNAARLAYQLESLPSLLKRGGFRGKRVVCALPASQTFAQHLQVAKVGGMSLLDSVRAELQAQVGCDPAKVVIRPVEVCDIPDAETPKTEIICFAVARDLVMRLIGAFKKQRLEVVGAHCQHIALLRAFDHITKRASDADLTSLYIDIGAAETKIVVARCRDIVFARTARFGGGRLDSVIASRIGCAAAEARARRIAGASYALAPASTRRAADGDFPSDGASGGLASLAAGMRAAGETPDMQSERERAAQLAALDERRGGAPAPGAEYVDEHAPASQAPDQHQDPMRLARDLEPLIDEISIGLRHHARLYHDDAIDRAIFVGGESRSRELCQHIARSLRLPAQIADPLAPLMGRSAVKARGVDVASPQPGWATPFGLSFCPEDA